MEAFAPILIGVVVLIVLLYAVPRLVGGNYVTCTRCEGTGQIDERWPDPAEASGFHVASGTCPKCKGKGRLKT